MSRDKRFGIGIALGLLLAGSGGLAGAAGAEEVTLTSALFWTSGFAAGPRLPLVGDADGDGRADLLALNPQGEGSLEWARTSQAGKPCYPTQARAKFGKEALMVLCGRFSGKQQAETLALLPDGAVHLASEMEAGKSAYAQDRLLLTLSTAQIPRAPVRAVIGDFDGDGRLDALLAGADGRLLLLHNRPRSTDELSFVGMPLPDPLPHLRQIAAGDFTGKGRAEVVWQDTDGKVYRTGLSLNKEGARLGRPRLLLEAHPDAHLAIGHFRGDKKEDLILGQNLLPEGNPKRQVLLAHLPTVEQAKEDSAWLVGDFDGDGKDDLLRVRRSKERFSGDDLLVHFARPAASDIASVNQANDGLPDFWKTGIFQPGGLDLAAMGCKPGHHDLIVEIQRMEDVPEAAVRSEMTRAVAYFASLPVRNPDGTIGVSLHVIYREPIPLSDKSLPWWTLGEKYHPANHRGITHWLVVYNGGGGQSGEMTDRGSCGVRALYATFLHEFGHQLGLGHTGFWEPNWCPTYPSLMNYAYNYQLNGRRQDIGYSDGRLASVVLNERHLSEKLPLPPDKIAFLAGPPYFYHLKPTEDGKGTLIDWNWNGIFGEEEVSADINYGYSTSAGNRHTIGKTYTNPALATLGEGEKTRLLIFYGQLPAGTPLPKADATAAHPGLAPDQPGHLVVRVWQGSNPAAEGTKWSNESAVEQNDVTGDPSAVSFADSLWIAYPTLTGVKIRRITLDPQGSPMVSGSYSIPDSQGAQPTLTPFAGRLALLLWHDARAPVGLRMVSLIPDATRGTPFREGQMPLEIESVSAESPLGFTSNAPVGAVAGSANSQIPSLWVALSQDQDPRRASRWQVRRFSLEPGGALKQTEQEWVGGENSSDRGSGRLLLLRESDPAFGPEGQLIFLSCGLFSKEAPWSCHYVATRVADKTVHGGWLIRRYYDEWTQSRSAPGACFFRGDLAFASRWFGNAPAFSNDALFVAFYGRGIETESMGDFDDIGFIRDIGMSHSIAYMKE